MALPPGWDVSHAAAGCPVVPWRGTAYRAHNSAFSGDSPLGSRRSSGRFHRGLDVFQPRDLDGYEPVLTPEEAEAAWDRYAQQDLVWEVLYTSSSTGVCLAENMRQLGKDTATLTVAHVLQFFATRQMTTLSLHLERALDCRDYRRLGLTEQGLEHYLFPYTDYELGQSLAFSALKMGCDGILVPTATKVPGFNIVPFTGKIPAGAVTLLGSTKLEIFPKDLLPLTGASPLG